MPQSERVLEVDDAEEQTDKLTQRDDERDRQRRTLRRQVVHRTDAQVSEVIVKEKGAS